MPRTLPPPPPAPDRPLLLPPFPLARQAPRRRRRAGAAPRAAAPPPPTPPSTLRWGGSWAAGRAGSGRCCCCTRCCTGARPSTSTAWCALGGTGRYCMYCRRPCTATAHVLPPPSVCTARHAPPCLPASAAAGLPPACRCVCNGSWEITFLLLYVRTPAPAGPQRPGHAAAAAAGAPLLGAPPHRQPDVHAAHRAAHPLTGPRLCTKRAPRAAAGGGLLPAAACLLPAACCSLRAACRRLGGGGPLPAERH